MKIVQRGYFSKEISALSANSNISKGSKLYKLDCFIDSKGLLRIGGRINRAAFSFEEKHPVVLPNNSPISVIIIDCFDRKVFHQGRGMVVSEIRSNGLWIIKLNNIVKRVIHRYVYCQRLRGKPIEQKMSDLPPDRLYPEPAFTNVGCDCFGPFTVKNGRSCAKRYGLLFTCLASRAVHIEMCFSLSTDSFLNAFNRFTSIRGPIKLLRCNRGINFYRGP